MNSHDDEKTMVFTPVEEEKKVVSRERVPEFNDDYIEEDLMREEESTGEKGSKALIYTLLILCMLLIIAVTAVIVLLSSGTKEKGEDNTPGGSIVQEEKNPPVEGEDDKKEEEKEIEIISCSVVFYGESAVESEDGYLITAKMTDNKTQRQKKKHLLIDDETEIRLNGKRVETESFIYLLEEKNEEKLVFDSMVDDEKDYITYISFEGDLSEKEEEPPIEEPEGQSEEEEIIEGINLQE